MRNRDNDRINSIFSEIATLTVQGFLTETVSNMTNSMDVITIYVVLRRNVMYVMYVLHFALGVSSAVTTFLRRNKLSTMLLQRNELSTM